MPESDREQSRGRNLDATGRGGAGNFVRSDSNSHSRSRSSIITNRTSEDGGERGREIYNAIDRVTHAGRGGQGNIRSPSHETIRGAQQELVNEGDIIRTRREEQAAAPSSTGRGGNGNISGSRDTTPEARPGLKEPGLGRGGMGNIEQARTYRSISAGELDKMDQAERVEFLRQEKEKATGNDGPRVHFAPVHSSGRGGVANITPLDARQPVRTQMAPRAPGVVSHTGRGGAGNIESKA